MAKDKIAYVCSNCGQESTKWIGKCPSCGQWNTFKEIRIANDTGSMAAKTAAHAVRNSLSNKNKPLFLREISAKDEPRIDMHDDELNRVLGGGLVPGSIVLLGGEPGIGKSTLTLQTILHMTEHRILYVSGEESAQQIKMRAERIGGNSEVMVLCETSLENIFDHIKEVKPELVIIDSIQTISTSDVESSPGSITQVRECAAALLRFAKTSAIPVILIGHIQRFWSTLWIRSFSLKVTSIICTGFSVLSRTVLGAHRNLEFMKCNKTDLGKYLILPNSY